MQIAIDGPAGAGKSTIAKKIAKALGIIYLDTGAMYRAITYGVLENHIPFSDTEAIIAFAQENPITFEGTDVFLKGKRVTAAIRTPEVSHHTSDIACIAAVRAIMVDLQRAIVQNTSVIMDGRDIGSVVLPQADYKFYLDASIAERAKRRLLDFEAAGIEKTLEEVEKDIERRDYNDSHREASPLVCTEDAISIDTTGLSIQEVCDVIIAHIQ